MIITRIQGGLGNQLFQYAFGLYLAGLSRQPLRLDLGWFNAGTRRNETKRSFELGDLLSELPQASERDIEAVIGGSTLLSLCRLAAKWHLEIHRSYCTEKKPFHFQYIDIRGRKHIYAEGYWQNWQYSSEVLSILREQLNLSVPMAMQMAGLNTANAVAVHVRRGDYVGHSMHPTLTPEYYLTALSELESKLERTLDVIVFSDDIDWCKKQFAMHLDRRKTWFVEQGTVTEQFRLMCNFRNYIIANSTFSWWAAWLSAHSDKVVFAPSQWIRGQQFEAASFFPPGWNIL